MDASGGATVFISGGGLIPLEEVFVIYMLTGIHQYSHVIFENYVALLLLDEFLALSTKDTSFLYDETLSTGMPRDDI